MFGHYMERRLLFLAWAEAAILILFFYVGYFGSYADTGSITKGLIAYLPQALIFSGAALLGMVTAGLYERGRVLGSRAMVLRLAGAFVATFVLVAIVSYAVPKAEIWRSGLSIAMPAAFAAILVLRLVVENSPLSRGFDRRVMVVGDAEANIKIDRILAAEASGEIAIGKPGLTIVDRLPIDGPLLWSNDIGALRQRAERLHCSEIVVALDDAAAEGAASSLPLSQLLECRLAGVRIVDLAEFCERETGRVDLDHLRRRWLMFAGGFETGRIDLIAKRVFDILVSLAVLVTCLPVMLLAMAAIKAEDGGPIFYSQLRVGRHGRAFPLLKFRSMRTDAERFGARYAEENDPRVTRVGRLLRRSRIDELPQLLNVLKGEMSFVGPRPERPVFVRELEHQLPFFKERHRVKPGISGWAQVNHAYTATIDDARVKLEYDIYYLKNWSLFLDLLILTQTLRVVVWGSGAR